MRKVKYTVYTIEVNEPTVFLQSKKSHGGPAKQVISGTENVTAILEPQVQSFCETVIEEGAIVVEAQEEAQQEIIKAATALENQNLPTESMFTVTASLGKLDDRFIFIYIYMNISG